MGRPMGSKNKPAEGEDAPVDVPEYKLPDIRVIERRIANPYGTSDEPIKLKASEPMYVRWFNGAISGRVYQALTHLGFVHVPRTLLADENQLAGLVDMGDGLVRRGERGVEVLCMQPMWARKKIEAAKAAARAKSKTPTRVKEDLAQQAAQVFGDEQADMVMGGHPLGQMVGGIEEGRERIHLDES